MTSAGRYILLAGGKTKSADVVELPSWEALRCSVHRIDVALRKPALLTVVESEVRFFCLPPRGFLESKPESCVNYFVNSA